MNDRFEMLRMQKDKWNVILIQIMRQILYAPAPVSIFNNVRFINYVLQSVTLSLSRDNTCWQEKERKVQ